ncbi:Lrp/AsnC family transcriptional regulator [Staphylococcus cohnii]|uniref:Lrp/AsnC family transcriptional regulator n=1 Tax=Staphylococcus TaxID=1279 RepID=UPI00061986CB|nr:MULTISPECIES: Lrp/AsnC family transcriptional regulator [Staphylococcus]KKD22734.1 AsnC family transcriptional regulator [Staphylococcus cohnii subsp. cohnii]KKD26190.1 AsnC family transcriptional regulator [Staphylococcus cohnii subsp. cohnii]MDQ7109295.1 Lrp/AsnC family transcriptional regulator [Staphylococcus ureilyticus]PUZ31294.1 Lrp/AsnC family transcriptional regulator [Staphylococcus cohnii]
MDLTDRKIIETLKKDSKVSLSYISNSVNLSTPSVRERINKMKDIGVIKKYTIDIDYKTLGYDIDVIIDIVIKNNLYKDFKTFITKQGNVEFCYRISGESCFIFKVRFKNMMDVEIFIDSLQRYGHTKTHFIFSKTI